MSVVSLAPGDLFVVRIIKHLITNPADQWANSYEFKSVGTGTESELLILAPIIVAFEAAFHYTTTIFDRIIISTWEADSVPYDPESFISLSLSDVGDLEATSDPLALNQCLSVTRVANSGRAGHIFYRNCVAEEDVQAPAGKLILNSRSTFQTRIDGALTSSTLADYIGTTPEGSLQLVMVNADGTQVRPVAGLFVGGMSTIKTDHKWFNRTSP
jgi:hypothetical protein